MLKEGRPDCVLCMKCGVVANDQLQLFVAATSLHLLTHA